MIQRIKSHNILNGIKFSIAEFILIALLITPFAIYYMIHAQVIYALISVGLILNCLTVAALGFQQWRAKEQGIGWRRLLNQQARDEIDRANPNLFRDTTIITLTTLVPFLLIVLVLYELASQNKGRNP